MRVLQEGDPKRAAVLLERVTYIEQEAQRLMQKQAAYDAEVKRAKAGKSWLPRG